MDKWYGNNDTQAKMPKLIGVNDYRSLVEKNYAYKDLEECSDNEYKIYQQLCWMKHSHPVMQALSLKENKVHFQIGPHTDENSINHAWFSIWHSGRLTELVIGNLESLKDEEIVKTELVSLAKLREELNKKALARFENNDNFK